MQKILGLLDTNLCQRLKEDIFSEFTKTRTQFPSDDLGDSLVPKSFSKYALACTEELLVTLTPTIENVYKQDLIPTYSYCRIYFKNNVMKQHYDRSACEVSLSISLDDDNWPLYFKIDNENIPVICEQGSGILYNGISTLHWRTALEEAHSTKIFLHWVTKNGLFSDWKYDKRPNIGSAESEKTYWGKL